MIGLFVTTYNHLEKTKRIVNSIRETVKYPYSLVLIDNFSNDGTMEWAIENNIPIELDKKGNNISAAFNQGVRYFIDNPEIEYIGNPHNDMEFYYGSVDSIIAFQKDTGISGKFTTRNTKVLGMSPEEAVKKMSEARETKNWKYSPGNDCPWFCTVDIFRKDKLFYDEGYVGIGGYDDWDFNRTIMKFGYKVLILEDVYVWHETMGTRKYLDQYSQGFYNMAYYCKKWGDGNCPV